MSTQSSPQKRPTATGFTLDEGTSGEGSGCRKQSRIDDDDISENAPVPRPRKTTGSGKPSRKLAAAHKIMPRKPQKGMSMRELTADWN